MQGSQPGGRLYAMRVAVPGLVLQFAFGLVYSWGIVAPAVRAQEHWSPLLVSAVFSGTPLGYGSGMVLAGRLADRFPPRRLCWASVGLLALGFAVAFLFPSGPSFVFGYAFLALGVGGALALSGALAAGLATFPRRVGLVGGALTGSYALAAVVQVPLVAALAARVGWLDALRLVGIGLGLLAATSLLLLPALSRPPARRAGRADASLPRLLGRPAIWSGCLLVASATPLGAYAFAALAGYLAPRAPAAWLPTLAVTLLAVGNAAGRVILGGASDRVGARPILVVVLVADLAAAALLQAPTSIPAVLLAAVCAGLGFGGPAGLLSRLAVQGAPEAPGAAFGLLFFGFGVGAVSGPLLGALVGGGAEAWLLLGALAAPGLVALVGRSVTRRAS